MTQPETRGLRGNRADEGVKNEIPDFRIACAYPDDSLRFEHNAGFMVGHLAGMNEFRLERGPYLDFIRFSGVQPYDATHYLGPFLQFHYPDNIRIVPAKTVLGHCRRGDKDACESCQFPRTPKLHPFQFQAETGYAQRTGREGQSSAFLALGAHDKFFIEKLLIGLIVESSL
jgi:hypothetical protein